MGTLKWIGYGVAAIIVLTVLTGVGIFIAAIVVLGGIALAAVSLVVLVAGFLRSMAADQ